MNLIYNLIAMGETDASKRCLLCLSEYYRHITQLSKQQIPLSEELDFIRVYLEIMQLRFPQKLNFTITCEAAVKSMPIPPLLLQPLVENAIKHGFADREKTYQIDVCARVLEATATITVRDNGVGFEQAYYGTYSADNDLPPLERTDDTHVGLLNIFQRLKMYYKQDAAFSISRQGHITEVGIKIHNYSQYM